MMTDLFEATPTPKSGFTDIDVDPNVIACQLQRRLSLLIWTEWLKLKVSLLARESFPLPATVRALGRRQHE